MSGATMAPHKVSTGRFCIWHYVYFQLIISISILEIGQREHRVICLVWLPVSTLCLVIVAVMLESASFLISMYFFCPNRVIKHLKTREATSISYVQYIAYTLELFPTWASLSLEEGRRPPGQRYTKSVLTKISPLIARDADTNTIQPRLCSEWPTNSSLTKNPADSTFADIIWRFMHQRLRNPRIL